MITGLRQGGSLKDTFVFHSGTGIVNGRTITAGGRVVGVTALGKSISQAVAQAYRAVHRIEFEGAHFRHDIAARALKQDGQRTAS